MQTSASKNQTGLAYQEVIGFATQYSSINV